MIILFDSDFREIGQVDIDLDIEFGTSTDSANTFEINTATIQGLNPYGFYIDGTEIGGIFEYSYASTENDYETLKGYTWRGLMALSIIEPPQGSDYKIVSGEANHVIAALLENVLGGFFNVSTIDSGLTLSNYQFPLYCNTLDGIEGMLEKFGYRLHIWTEKSNTTKTVRVNIEAVESQQVSGIYNVDNRIPMSFVLNNMGINHLVCAGQGELQERMKIHLYIDDKGNISQTQYYTGFEERTAFYDYSSAESEDDLIAGGTERLKQLASSKTLSMKAPDDYELNIGDTVRGVFPDLTEIISPIVNIIYKIQGGTLTTEYRIKGEH